MQHFGVQLPEWLDRVEGRPAPDGDEPDDALVLLEQAATDLRSRLGGADGATHGPPWPITLTQQMVASLHRCEQLAVQEAVAHERPAGWELFRGRALDAYVCHVIHSGPVADPVEDLRSFWFASDRPGDMEVMEQLLGGPGRGERIEDLARLAARAGSFARVARLSPRVEVGLAALPAGFVRLPGRVDVLLGGPGTGAPAVLIEVKSGAPHPDHGAQLRHYMMLSSLVHGSPPAAAAIWYPGGAGDAGTDTVLEVPVAGAVISSARRVEGALDRLAELWEGRVPSRAGGPHCNWCPLADDCPEVAEGGSGDHDR